MNRFKKHCIEKPDISLETTILKILEAYLLTNREFFQPDQVEHIEKAIQYQRERSIVK